MTEITIKDLAQILLDADRDRMRFAVYDVHWDVYVRAYVRTLTSAQSEIERRYGPDPYVSVTVMYDDGSLDLDLNLDHDIVMDLVQTEIMRSCVRAAADRPYGA